MNANEKAIEALDERVALVLYNEYRRRCGMEPVDYIGANQTPACETCRSDARAALAALAEAAAVPPDVAGVEPVAWQWRCREVKRDRSRGPWEVWKEGRKPQFRGGTYEAEERPLYSVDALASLAARAEALAQLNARLEDHLYEARQSAEAEATRLRGELARVRAETVEECAKVADDLAAARRRKEEAIGGWPWTATPVANHFWCEEIAAAIRTLGPRHD